MSGPVMESKGGVTYFRPDIELHGRIKVIPQGNDGKRLKMRDDDGRLHVKTLASTPDLDLDGDIVLPEAFRETIPEYAKNPMQLAYHRMDWPTGLWDERQAITEAGLELAGWIQASEQQIQEKVLDGVLVHSSIGYFPQAVDWNEEQEAWIISKLSLFETSLVPVPANPGTFVEAARRAVKSIEENDPRRWKALTGGRGPGELVTPPPAPPVRKRLAGPRPADLVRAADLVMSEAEWTERSRRVRRDVLGTAARLVVNGGDPATLTTEE